MKPILAALVAAFCFVLSACTTTAELKALDQQHAERMAALKMNEEAQARAENNRLRLAQEREITLRVAEVTRQEQAKANVVRYGAYIKIAEKADAGGRVAIARSLEERPESVASAAAALPPLPEVPRAAPIQLPPFQMPKSAVDRWLDAGKAGWGLANETARLFLGYKSFGKQLDADVEIRRLTEQGATDRHGATMGAFGRFSDNQTALGIAGVNGARDVGVEAARTPHIVNNVNGTGNKVNVGGRDANFRDETTTTTTNTVECPQTQDSRSGQSGTGAPSGNTTTGQSQGGTSGQTGPATASQVANCNAGK